MHKLYNVCTKPITYTLWLCEIENNMNKALFFVHSNAVAFSVCIHMLLYYYCMKLFMILNGTFYNVIGLLLQ